MKCATHPRYKAIRHPQKTVKHPDGCPTCWHIWDEAKKDPHKLLKTVNIELTRDEARVLMLTLDKLMKQVDEQTARILQPFYLTMMQLMKNAL